MKILRTIIGLTMITGLALVSCNKETEEIFIREEIPYFGIADAYKTISFGAGAGEELIGIATNIQASAWKDNITYSNNGGAWCTVQEADGKLRVSVQENPGGERTTTVKIKTEEGKELSFTVQQSEGSSIISFLPSDMIVASSNGETIELVVKSSYAKLLPYEGSRFIGCDWITIASVDISADGTENIYSLVFDQTTSRREFKAEFAVEGSDALASVVFKQLGRELVVLARAGWTVTASHAHIAEANPYKGTPESIIDNDIESFLSLRKAGNINGSPAGNDGNGNPIPEGTPIYFIVDMKEQKSFDYVQFSHRNSTNSSHIGLRVWKFSLFGSNDGVNFTPIEENIDVPNYSTISVITPPPFMFDSQNYRYIKMQWMDWNKTMNTTLQIADFKVGEVREITED